MPSRTRVRRRAVTASVLPLLWFLVVVAGPSAAEAHQSGCHSAHSCPSDHHTYVWYDGSGAGWDCVQPGANEYDGSQDTATITYDGRTYYCRPGASAPPPPPPPPDADGDGVPDDPDGCATVPGPSPSGCPAPADTGGDAVPDPSDACPTLSASTTNGCPAPPPSAPTPPCQVDGPYPDEDCTPGKVYREVTAKKVCRPGYSKRVRKVSESTKERVYARYGITDHSASTYEIDHFIPLELGGSNSIRNLFPEAASSSKGFRQKDKLENALHRRVCDDRMRLARAQRVIRKDWVAAYKRYVKD